MEDTEIVNEGVAEDAPLDRLVIGAGELIHVHGMPFLIEEATVILGRKENLTLIEGSPIRVLYTEADAEVQLS